MKVLTRYTDYAIRALTCIAGDPAKMVSVRELADNLEIPRPFLRKILQKLTYGGILRSVKGKGGGFSLTKDPSEISVLDVINVFQGQFELNDHLVKGRTCKLFNVCMFKKKLDNIEKHVKSEFSAITIASLLTK